MRRGPADGRAVHAGRHPLPGLVNSQRSGQFTCELPGVATDDGYWEMAGSRIRRTLSWVQQAVADEEITHISVFAIGPVPVLVLLGAELDDKVETRLWQKHCGAGWAYPSADAPVAFAVDATDPAGQGREATDVVLVCSLSAEVDASRLPVALRNVPVLTLRPDGVPSSPSVLEHEDTLAAFERRSAGCSPLRSKRTRTRRGGTSLAPCRWRPP